MPNFQFVPGPPAPRDDTDWLHHKARTTPQRAVQALKRAWGFAPTTHYTAVVEHAILLALEAVRREEAAKPKPPKPYGPFPRCQGECSAPPPTNRYDRAKEHDEWLYSCTRRAKWVSPDGGFWCDRHRHYGDVGIEEIASPKPVEASPSDPPEPAASPPGLEIPRCEAAEDYRGQEVACGALAHWRSDDGGLWCERHKADGDVAI